MISVRHLQKTYVDPDGSLFPVLKDIHCDIQPGEIISIIGPSGTGKSTFLRALNLLDPPTSGEILVDGENILAKGYPIHKLRRRMGMVFQHFNLFPQMTVLENVIFAPVHILGLSREQAEEDGMALLRKVGMAEKAAVLPDMLSGGQKQRVAIARCLAMKPETILFDEPTSALDPTMTGEVLSVIRSLAREEKRTMLIVTHELDFAQEISTRIFYMDKGVIYEDGTPDQIFKHPVHSATKAFIQRIQKLVFDVKDADFDFYGMVSEMNRFCIKYDIPQKREALTHIAEEMIHVILKDHLPLHVVLSYTGATGEVSIAFMMAGRSESPLKEDGVDEIALGMVRGMSAALIEEPTSLGYRIKAIV